MGFKLNYGLCVSSEWLDNVLRIAPDALGDGGANEQMSPMQPLGIFARPADPEDGKGAGAVYGTIGDENFAWPTTDVRCTNTVPQAPKGSLTVYLPSPEKTSYHHFDASGDGSGYQQILVKYGDKSLSITLDTSTEGQEAITVRHGDNPGIVINKDGIVLETGGDCWIEMKASVITFHGPVQFNGGVMLGGQAGNAGITNVDIDTLIGLINTMMAGTTAAGAPVAFTALAPGTIAGSSKVKIAP